MMRHGREQRCSPRGRTCNKQRALTCEMNAETLETNSDVHHGAAYAMYNNHTHVNDDVHLGLRAQHETQK